MDNLWTEEDHSVTVVHLAGEYGSVDVHYLAHVEGMLFRAASACKPPLLLLDFQQTDYFGAGFISVLLRTYDLLMHRSAGVFALCGLNPELQNEVEILRLDDVWRLYDSCDEGISNVQSMSCRLPTDLSFKRS